MEGESKGERGPQISLRTHCLDEEMGPGAVDKTCPRGPNKVVSNARNLGFPASRFSRLLQCLSPVPADLRFGYKAKEE